MKLKLSQRAYLTVVIPLALQICFLLVLGFVLDISEQQAADEYRSKEVIGHSNWLTVTYLTANLSAWAYVVDNDNFFLKTCKDAQSDALKECDQLATLYVPGEAAYDSVWALRKSTQHLFTVLNAAINTKDVSQLNPERLKPIWTELSAARKKLVLDDRKLYQLHMLPLLAVPEKPDVRAIIHTAITILAAIDLAAGIVLLILFNRHIATRLAILMENTLLFAKGRELRPSFGGSDELGELDSTFHSMAMQVKAAQDALSESEERMRLLVENVPSALLGIDKTFVVQSANPAAAQLLESNRDELLNAPLKDLLNLGALQFRETFEHAMKKPVELFINLKSEEKRPIEMSVSQYRFGGNEMMLVTMQDLRDRYEAERLKQEFVGMVGHDLKSPLTVIENLCELLSSDTLGPLNNYGKKMVELASTQLKRLSRLVGDLTDVAHIESSTFSLEKRDVLWSSLVQQARDAVIQQAEERKIEIASAGEDLWLEVDPIRIVQVLVNLTGNALKFSPGGSRITMSIENEGETVMFKVSDQGRGIPAADIDRIFERFQQVSQSDAKLKGGLGLGLGLAICKAIVQQHDGTMGVTSEEGKGSTFWFRLPCSHEQVE
ncbi:MAG TPA: ATP-binding protein [Planktothrix sp.]